MKLSDDINELKEAIYYTFQENIHQSGIMDFEIQRPDFVWEILIQKSAIELFDLLKSKTPYCSIINFLKFIEQVADKLDNKDAKEVISASKKILYSISKDDIMPHVDKYHLQKENFTKVVLQMRKGFKIFTCGEIDCFKELISFILSLKNLVCFAGIDDECQTVTCLIPSILTEGAYRKAYQSANQFSCVGILSITIGGIKIFPRMSNLLQQPLPCNQSMITYLSNNYQLIEYYVHTYR